MKRIVPLLLSLLLLGGCAGAAMPLSAAVRAETAAAPETTPEPLGAPQATAPFLIYDRYDRPDGAWLMAAVMFEADLDQDGTAEPVAFSCDEDEDVTVISWGESSVTLTEGADFVEAAVLDLDPESPFYNLLAVIDYGSDSYVTLELHPENGQLVRGPMVGAGWAWEDGALWFYERTDFLGTAFGRRSYSGDDLKPDGDWLTLSYIPDEGDLAEDWASLVDGGVLLHTVLPVPCTIDGESSVIPADTYVYRLRFRSSDDLAEVALPDGTVARIACTLGEHGWPYLIDGRDMLDYFDNLFFAD